jgi:hypothetical protein
VGLAPRRPVRPLKLGLAPQEAFDGATAFSLGGRVIDEILERAVPWGAFIALGALIGAAFPRETRSTAKRVMLAGMRASDWARTFGAEAYEKGQDVFAEARLEYEQAAQESERRSQRESLRVVSPARRRSATRRSSRSRGHEGQEASTPTS